MALFVWQQALEPDFPLTILEHETRGDQERMHWHDHLEIALVLDGSGVFRFGGREHPAEPGDAFFIDNSLPHVALPAPGGSLRLLLVLFRPELVAGPGCRGFDAGYLAPFRADERSFSGRVAGGTPCADEVAAAIRDLRATWARHNPAERLLLDATLRRVLALVIRDGQAPCAGVAGDEAGPGVARAAVLARAAADRAAADRREQIRPVLAYVERHCRDSVTLGDVAAVVHVSPSRVRHVFKDVTGVGFKEYVTHVRVAEAKRLLLATDLTVAEVARAVSYTNLNQFYRVFYRSCAMSPAEYRRQYTPAGRDETDAGIDHDAEPVGSSPR